MKRTIAGLAAASVIPVVTSSLLIQATSRTAGNVPPLSGAALWLIAWVCLAVVSVILGRAVGVTMAAAGGVLVVGLSLGAVSKAADAPDAVGAALVVTLSFVVMAAGATAFHAAEPKREAAIACTFWLLGACILAGSTWNCAICGGAPRCRIISHRLPKAASAPCAVTSDPSSLQRIATSVQPAVVVVRDSPEQLAMAIAALDEASSEQGN